MNNHDSARYLVQPQPLHRCPRFGEFASIGIESWRLGPGLVGHNYEPTWPVEPGRFNQEGEKNGRTSFKRTGRPRRFRDAC
jgi:hypothetical protein